jgi:hypothetical protein
MTPVTILVNIAAFVGREGARERQAHALNMLEQLAPPWCQVAYAFVTHDLLDLEIGHAKPMCHLPRDAADSLEGALHLPYVQDMIDGARTLANVLHGRVRVGDWIGFINNDNIVTPKFFSHFQNTDANCLMVRVSDIQAQPVPGSGPLLLRRRHNPYSLDGLFIRGTARDAFWETYPDYVLGDGWDPGTVQWAQRHEGEDIKGKFIDDDSCLHVVHGGSPARGKVVKKSKTYEPTVVGIYNQSLSKQAGG